MELKDYLRILRRRWPIVLIVSGTFLLISLLYANQQPEKYASSVEITMKKSTFRMVGAEFPALFQGYFSWNAKVKMIRSREVLEAAILSDLLSPHFANQIPSEDSSHEEREGKELVSYTLREERINQIVKEINAGITISSDKDSNSVVIQYVDSNKQKAVDVVNAIASAYEKKSKDMAVAGIENALTSIETIVQQRQSDINSMRERISKFPTGSSYKDLESQLNQQRKAINTLNDKKIEHQNAIHLADVKISNLNKLLTDGKTNYTSSQTNQSQSRVLRTELNEKEKRLAFLLRTYTRKAPVVQDLAKEIESIKKNLLDVHQKDSLIQTVSGKLAALDQIKKHIAERNELFSLNEKILSDIEHAQKEHNETMKKSKHQDSVEYQEQILILKPLEDQLDYLKKSRDNFIQQKNKLIVNKSLIDSPVHKMSVARHASAYKQSGPGSLPFILMTALITGLGCAYIMEYLDTSIRTEQDVRRYLNAPVLTTIAKIKDANERLLINSAPKSPLFEIFNTLGTVIESYSHENHAKSFMISSTKAEEGKSTITTNIAVSLAHMGVKVTIIDCDLRKSIMHRFFNVKNDIGLCTYIDQKRNISSHKNEIIHEEELSVDDIIKRTSIENLNVITVGHHPRNPVALLRSTEFKELLDEVKDRSDIVLVDIPPMNIAVDTMVLAPIIDGTILLVSAGAAHKDEITETKRNIEVSKGTLVGCILNKVSINSRSYYYYYYSYKYSREV